MDQTPETARNPSDMESDPARARLSAVSAPPPPPPDRSAPSCLTLFSVFFRVVAVTPGGGLVMLPILQEEFVERRGWISREDMVDVVAMVQSLPGLIAMNMAVLTGYRMRGVRGALASAAGAALPPFAVILFLAAAFLQVGDGVWTRRAFLGIRAAVCAFILLSVAGLGKSVMKGAFEWALAVASFALVVSGGVNVVWLVVAGAVAGLVWKYGMRR